MAKVIKVLKTLRNNWKKSIFFFSVASYGVNYGIDKYNSFQLMRAYCEQAMKYGEMPLPSGGRPRQITVILNPAANKRKSRNNYEKYCAPLLHLAGISVNIIQTEFEGQARDLVNKLDGVVDAIVVAGGDGTASEIVTGLLRRLDGDRAVQNKFPIGILPLGRTNTVAKSLFCYQDDVKMMAEATMAIIEEVTTPIDVMKIEVIELENEQPNEQPAKPVYCLGGIQWGAYRDAHAKRDKYWYWGELRSYITYIFMGMKNEKSGISWQCDGQVHYVLPCGGCSKCVQVTEPSNKSSRWWHTFLPRSPGAEIPTKDYSKVINEECGTKIEQEISTVDFCLTTSNSSPNSDIDEDPHIQLTLGPQTVSYGDFVSEGWRRASGNSPSNSEVLKIRELELRPTIKENSGESENWISIDNEEYEVKAIHATLLPKKVHVFHKPTPSFTD